MPVKSRMWGRGTFIGIAAIGLLVVVLGVPLVVGRIFSSKAGLQRPGTDQATMKEERGRSSHRKRLEASIQFSEDSPVMRIAHDVRLDPVPDQFKTALVSQKGDSRFFWAFFAAVKVRHLSAKGARHIFVLKYDGNTPLHPGWGIAFHKLGNDIFPEVYWGTSRKKGLWYRFMPVSVHAGDWWAVGLSFEEDRYLVLHTQPLYGDIGENHETKDGVLAESEQAKGSFRPFRGAYDLKDAGAAFSSADLMLGASPGSNFKGGFGFFGVARVNQERSEKWFNEAVNMINTVNRTTNGADYSEESREWPVASAFKSDDFEFIFGSFDGKHEVVAHKPLP